MPLDNRISFWICEITENAIQKCDPKSKSEQVTCNLVNVGFPWVIKKSYILKWKQQICHYLEESVVLAVSSDFMFNGNFFGCDWTTDLQKMKTDKWQITDKFFTVNNLLSQTNCI